MRPSLALGAKLLLAISLVLLVALAVPFGKSDPQHVSLHVAYVAQALDGDWVAPWDEACEEASLLMVEAYYDGQIAIPKKQARGRMQDMFDWEDRAFQKNDDTDAEQTTHLVSQHTSFHATVIRNPTLGDIKHELSSQRPVIAFVNMYQLYQEPDLGDSFHVLVITGYDDQAQTFHVNDPARKNQHTYPYAVLLNALHDYNPETKEANGTPTVLFTSP
jgi:hypothetical protein